MKNDIYDMMLSQYDMTTEQNKRNAVFEVNQQVILAGLYNGGFFESAAFNGDTCLRLAGGAQAIVNFAPFSSRVLNINNNGLTIEFEFAIRDVNNRDTIVIDCFDGQRGILRAA